MPPFADLISQGGHDLGEMSARALLGVAVMALTVSLVTLFRLWRADVSGMQAKHDQEKRDQRGEFLSAIREVTAAHGAAISQLAAESKANTLAISQLAAESKANTEAILDRLERVEMHLPAGKPESAITLSR